MIFFKKKLEIFASGIHLLRFLLLKMEIWYALVHAFYLSSFPVSLLINMYGMLKTFDYFSAKLLFKQLAMIVF